MLISIIAAVDARNGIGKNNELLCRIAEDMKRFKKMTIGKTIIMGRKTYQGIGMPLPKRTNIVLSRTIVRNDGIMTAACLEDALMMCNDSDVFVIGGANVFRAAMQAAQRMYLTKIHASFDADTYFPSVDMAQWQEIKREHFEKGKNFPHSFDFIVYEKNQKISTI
jgi:dihydrofolate reductase